MRRVIDMYDKDLSNKWHVEIEFTEDDIHTHASVHAQLRDGTIATTGDAYRNPRDPSAPTVGEEIAAARALIALGTELLHLASARIEQGTHHPVHLYR
jgi:Rv2632c-like